MADRDRLVGQVEHPFVHDPTLQPEPALIDEVQRQGEQALEEALRDPSAIAARRVLDKVFERELDEIHTPDGSSYWSQPERTQAEEDALKREEHLMLGVIAAHCIRGLREHGIRVSRLLPAAEEHGGGEYVLYAQDTAGRPFEVKFGLELFERVAKHGETNYVFRVAQAVVRATLDERARYMKRMGA